MRRYLLGVALCAGACVGAGEELAAPVEPEAARAVPPSIPEVATGEPRERRSIEADAAEEMPRAWSLGEDDVLLQIDLEPTFAAVTVGNPFHAYGRVPDVTLYRDGTVIYDGSSGGTRGVLTYRFGERVAARHHAHALELGIEDVESREDDCRPTAEGEICMSDASIVILRVRRSDGTMKELRNYGGWALAHEAVLHAVYDRLELLKTPPGWGAELFVPRHATLFLRGDRDRAGEDATSPWPLASELAERALHEKELALAIDAPTIRTLVAALGTNATRGAAFRYGDHVMRVGLVPWLPGADHPALERWPAPR